MKRNNTLLRNNRKMLAAVGGYLRLCRQKSNMTIFTLSQLTGVVRGTFYAIERGEASYYLVLWAYVKYCDADIDYINLYISQNIKWGDGNGE